MKKKVTIKIGSSFLSSLALLFIALKLCHVIDWSWLWVTAPLWGPFALVAACGACVVAVILAVGLACAVFGVAS